jgi:hypothetical protein
LSPGLEKTWNFKHFAFKSLEFGHLAFKNWKVALSDKFLSISGFLQKWNFDREKVGNFVAQLQWESC